MALALENQGLAASTIDNFPINGNIEYLSMLNIQNRLLKFPNGSLSNLKLGNWTIKSKLQGLLLGVSLGSVVVVSGIGWYQTEASCIQKL